MWWTSHLGVQEGKQGEGFLRLQRSRWWGPDMVCHLSSNSSRQGRMHHRLQGTCHHLDQFQANRQLQLCLLEVGWHVLHALIYSCLSDVRLERMDTQREREREREEQNIERTCMCARGWRTVFSSSSAFELSWWTWTGRPRVKSLHRLYVVCLIPYQKSRDST